jgi:hypothetical protein
VNPAAPVPQIVRLAISLSCVWGILTCAWGEELLDISAVPEDLVVPAMTIEAPAAGKRVRATTPNWEATEVYHALYLPPDWAQGQRLPVIAEWAGNGPFRNGFGDVSTGRVEDSRLGYGISAGTDCIWVCLPYLNAAGTANVSRWWGNHPGYETEPTLAYCRATIQDVCARFGGDPARVVLAGFSRGAIACNYLGLHDDATAALWCGFIAYSHYDGALTAWPYPGADRDSAQKRLLRLGDRPQFICAEGANATETRRYLEETGWLSRGNFTFTGTGFRNHNDAWVLRPSPARAQLRSWFQEVIR